MNAIALRIDQLNRKCFLSWRVSTIRARITCQTMIAQRWHCCYSSSQSSALFSSMLFLLRTHRLSCISMRLGQARISRSSARAASESIYRQAVDLNFPGSSTGVNVPLSAQIPASKIAGLIPSVPTKALGSDVYVAYVAWLLPITTTNTIDGNVQINVWMSSSEGLGGFDGSGYFFAIADVNTQNPGDSSFQNLCYNGNSGLGNVLGSTPKLVSTASFTEPFKISQHQFQSRRSLAFFAGRHQRSSGGISTSFPTV